MKSDLAVGLVENLGSVGFNTEDVFTFGVVVGDFQGLACTGKSLSEALILGSTNPQYDKRLFIYLPVQYMKTTSSEHGVYINWFFLLLF